MPLTFKLFKRCFADAQHDEQTQSPALFPLPMPNCDNFSICNKKVTYLENVL